MVEEDEEYGEAANPVKRWNVGEAAGVLGIARSEVAGGVRSMSGFYDPAGLRGGSRGFVSFSLQSKLWQKL
jgi:hypothetical protein